MNSIHILLPVHNRKAITQSFVDCLVRQTYKKYHLILIDDGSTDGTEEMVRNLVPDVTILKGDGNLWWAGALQKGLDWLKASEVSDSDIVLFINDDVAFGPEYLFEAVAAIRNKPNVMLLSQFCCENGDISGDEGVAADLARLTFKKASSSDNVNCLPTRGLFIRFGDVKMVGDFHPRILPHYLSDYEYTIRAFSKGMKYESTPNVCLCPNLETTGYYEFNNLPLLKYLRRYFSVKSMDNPIYWSSFVVLTVPKRWILFNLMRVWYGAFKRIFLQLVVSVSQLFGNSRA